MSPICMGEAVETAKSPDLNVHYISTYSTKLFPSAEIHISCLVNPGKKKPPQVNVQTPMGSLFQILTFL